MNIERVVEDMQLLEFVVENTKLCDWAMCFVDCEMLGWAGFKQVVVVEVRLWCKEYPYSIPLSHV